MFRLFLYLYGMKAKELVYNLRTNLGKVGSQLQFATDQHLMYMLDSARAVLAARKMDKLVNITQFIQTLAVTPVNATTAEVGSIGNNRVMKLALPEIVAAYDGPAVLTVGSTDGQETYTPISFSDVRTTMFRKYTANTPKWFFLEDAIYIINSEIDGLGLVRVRARRSL